MTMKKIFTIILFATISCQLISAKTISDADKIKTLEEKCFTLQSKQVRIRRLPE